MAEKDPHRTPAAWTAECLALLQAVHPDYRRNREATGVFIEFVRPGPGGLLISQNFLRRRDSYSLSVALLFGSLNPRACPWLYHPLFAGSRFDHNQTVCRQLADDFGLKRGDPGCPAGLWSFGKWRSNTLPLLVRSFAANEEGVIPRYIEALRPGKDRLVRLFEAARRIIPQLDRDAPVATQADRFGASAQDLAAYPLRAARLEALTLARGGRCYLGFGPESNTVDLDTISPELLVLHFADLFMAESGRLDEMLAIAQSL